MPPESGGGNGEAGEASTWRSQGLYQATPPMVTTVTQATPMVAHLLLTIVHALLADPDLDYHDLGPGYYEQRLHTHRQARNHIRSLERLGYKVTIQTIDPSTGELLAPAS